MGYLCVACSSSRPMQWSSIHRHCQNVSHVRNVQVWTAQQLNRNLDDTRQPSPSPREIQPDDHVGHDLISTTMVDSDHDDDEDERQKTIVELWSENHSKVFDLQDNVIFTDDKIGHDNYDDTDGTEGDDHGSTSDRKFCNPSENDSNDDWAPFTSLEQLVGLLVLGSTRTQMGRLQYDRVRSFVALLGVKLPGYNTLRNFRSKLKTRYNFNVAENFTPLGRPCFTLKELSNPYVTEFLKFMPELPLPTSKITSLVQSKKWREELDRDLRVQMVALPHGHFYILELVQMKSKAMVIPEFFYQQGTDTFAKCVPSHHAFETDSDGTARIRISFPTARDFNSPLLMSVNVNDFWRPFGSIEVRPGVLLKDVCGTSMYEDVGDGIGMVLPCENPWRKKAAGKAIRHMPLVLYCDELSGNVSKRWNKHIAFYFTLAGLPPKLSNQEFNCHFVTTSNTAGALELADPLVDELNDIATNGFFAYDHQSDSKVLVMAVVLCHLGDSPMHAEVTNTMNPTVSLTPCRICHLKVESLMNKRTDKYVSQFVGVDKMGVKSSLPTRSWSDTQDSTKALWTLAQQPGTIGAFDTESAKLGVKDVLNTAFVKRVQDYYRDPKLTNADVLKMCEDLNTQFGERLFNPFLRLKGFNGHRDTPVEILHVLLLGVAKYLLQHQMQKCSAKEKDEIWGRWQSFNTSGLKVPPIQPKSMITHFLSLTGKEFRVVLQSAPFIFFHCSSISKEERDAWSALSHLSPYIFQTSISDMVSYLKQLKNLIQTFLRSILHLSVQWCNKTKFHMLIHLCDAIEYLGPACLFATKSFESYNGNTRQSSIHSNHLSPSKDIANSFNNHRLMRSITSGCLIYDNQLYTYVRASSKVAEIFKTNVVFQKSLGYHSQWNAEKQFQMGKTQVLQPVDFNTIVPRAILEAYQAKEWKVYTSFVLQNGQTIRPDVFVLASSNSLSAYSPKGKIIGRVKRIWGAIGFTPHKCKLEITLCERGEISDFYGMRELEETPTIGWLNPEDIEAVLNIQHDCHKSGCQVKRERAIYVERRVSKNKEPLVVHQETSNFIINSASFYYAELHREWANVTFEEVSAASWRSALATGVHNWEQALQQKQDLKDKQHAKGKAKAVAREDGAENGFTGSSKKKRKTIAKNSAPHETQPAQETHGIGVTDFGGPSNAPNLG